jgi:hypothetical protein
VLVSGCQLWSDLERLSVGDTNPLARALVRGAQDAAATLEAAGRPYPDAAHARAPRSLAVSPCGRLLATAARDDTRCLLHGASAANNDDDDDDAGGASPSWAGASRALGLLRAFDVRSQVRARAAGPTRRPAPPAGNGHRPAGGIVWAAGIACVARANHV